MTDPQGLGYAETDQRLAVRIHAHQAFATHRLEAWLAGVLAIPPGGRLLEVGCGSGNLFGVAAEGLGPQGWLIGFDVSDSLLRAACRAVASLPVRASILKADFDRAFPLSSHAADITLCAYAAYYARDAVAWTAEALRVTRPGGQIALLGPTDDNAAELYELNERVTGIGHIAETDYTTRRLAGEFLPALTDRLGTRVRAEVLDRRLDFPSAEAFARYYQATWLYEKTCDRLGRTFALEEVAAHVETRHLSKRVLLIDARP